MTRRTIKIEVIENRGLMDRSVGKGYPSRPKDLGDETGVRAYRKVH